MSIDSNTKSQRIGERLLCVTLCSSASLYETLKPWIRNITQRSTEITRRDAENAQASRSRHLLRYSSGSPWFDSNTEAPRHRECTENRISKITINRPYLPFQKIIRNSKFRIENSIRLILICLFAACFPILSGCNQGLSPTQASSSVKPGFGGTVRFVSAWPPADSVQDLRIVAFHNYPPTNIYNEVLNRQAVVYPAIGMSGLPKFVDSLSYAFTFDSAATFQYVVVALQYGSNIFQDWKVVGAYGYSHGKGSPKTVVVPPNTFVNGIDIDVDFENTPPTPFSSLASPVSGN